MTDPDPVAQAVEAATSDDTARRIDAAIVGRIDEALAKACSLDTLHAADEAISTPGVGAVSRAVDPIAQALDDAINEALEQGAPSTNS